MLVVRLILCIDWLFEKYRRITVSPNSCRLQWNTIFDLVDYELLLKNRDLSAHAVDSFWQRYKTDVILILIR